MHQHAPITVQSGGAIRAFVVGFFGLLIAIVLCSAGVGMYALNVVDRKADTLLDMSGAVVGSLPEVLPKLQEALPPALADALRDERRPDYRDQVNVMVRLAPMDVHGRQRVVIEADNQGAEVLSLLAVRVVLVDADGTPVQSTATYVATPLTADHEWRGPLMPGSKRLCSVLVFDAEDALTPQVEVTDLRVWRGSSTDRLATAD